MMVTRENIDHVADLVKLALTEEEKEQLTKDLDTVVSYMSTMNEVDTDKVQPMTHVLPLKNLFRQDLVGNSSDQEQILSNAPCQKDGSFKVPKTVD